MGREPTSACVGGGENGTETIGAITHEEQPIDHEPQLRGEVQEVHFVGATTLLLWSVTKWETLRGHDCEEGKGRRLVLGLRGCAGVGGSIALGGAVPVLGFVAISRPIVVSFWSLNG